jgi:hypothetical protein
LRGDFLDTIVPATSTGDDIARVQWVAERGRESEHVKHEQRAVGELAPEQVMEAVFRGNAARRRALPGVGVAVQRLGLLVVVGVREFACLDAVREGD